MPKFNIVVPHSHTKEEATERLNRFLDQIRDKYQDQVNNLQQSWDGDTLKFSFTTFGIPLKGSVTVTDQQLNVDGELPIAAMMFKNKIESSIREELEKLMASA